jgi:pimeloyl-ACP methyl ester carboxylesterase
MLPVQLRVLYLHGFASSPESRKARFFSERLRQHGFTVDTPDLAEGNFSKLTITGQLKAVKESLHGQSAILIGSSLGGYLAGLYARHHTTVNRLILLAPAFRFHKLWTERLTREQLSSWKESGTIPVFHYAAGSEVPLGYQFLDDAARYEPMPSFPQPALIFHGTQDDVVPLESSSEFARTHDNVRLVSLPSGHELTDVLEEIWRESEGFLLEALSNSE